MITTLGGQELKKKSRFISVLATGGFLGSVQKAARKINVYCSTCQDRRVLALLGVNTCCVIPTF